VEPSQPGNLRAIARRAAAIGQARSAPDRDGIYPRLIGLTSAFASCRSARSAGLRLPKQSPSQASESQPNRAPKAERQNQRHAQPCSWGEPRGNSNSRRGRSRQPTTAVPEGGGIEGPRCVVLQEPLPFSSPRRASTIFRPLFVLSSVRIASHSAHAVCSTTQSRWIARRLPSPAHSWPGMRRFLGRDRRGVFQVREDEAAGRGAALHRRPRTGFASPTLVSGLRSGWRQLAQAGQSCPQALGAGPRSEDTGDGFPSFRFRRGFDSLHPLQ
jgi:hypothetical protein